VNIIKDLLFQALLLIIPVFIYQAFWVDRGRSFRISSYNSRPIITLLCCLMIVLCMTFAVSPIPGYIFDFRVIPLLIAILYGGYISGIISTAVLFLYRYFLGGAGGIGLTFIFYSIALVAGCMLVPYYRRLSLLQKTILATGFVFFISLSFILAILYEPSSFDQEALNFLISYLAISAFAAWIVIFSIENLIKKIKSNLVKLQREEMLKAISEMAATVAHEVRNPMMVVRGFIQLLQEEPSIPEKKRSYIKIAIQELDRAQDIIDDYLALAKSHKPTLTRIHVKTLIRDVIDIMSSYALLRDVTFIEQLDGKLYIQGDTAKLKQVLVNLMKNGIEAKPKDGKLNIRATSADSHVHIEVIDKGIGMSPEQLQQVGSPFYSTKEGGTGLGLLVCYRIIESHQGSIKVVSTQGIGTCFSIAIPLAID
jgi:two-component system sporulation sensor kinase B